MTDLLLLSYSVSKVSIVRKQKQYSTTTIFLAPKRCFEIQKRILELSKLIINLYSSIFSESVMLNNF